MSADLAVATRRSEALRLWIEQNLSAVDMRGEVYDGEAADLRMLLKDVERVEELLSQLAA